MSKLTRRLVIAAIVAATAATVAVRAQQQGTLTAAEKARRWDLENQLQALAIVDRKVMMPMPDGVRLATDIYRPKRAAGAGENGGKVPTIWVRTPYNFNFWDVQNGVPADMSAELEAVKRGYAYVIQNERGHFFSEGNYDILGSRQDGYNTVDWLTKQAWSNGKIGTTGCSSTAEYQMGVAALGHPGYAAMNVQGFGAGVGRVGPYYEQGNWYRGGAVQMLFITWLYGEQNQVRPMFPPGTSREDLIRASKSFDLAQHLPPVDWSKELWRLPEQDIIKNVDGPHGIYADAMPVETGGKMIQRAPNDAAWYRGGLYHDDMKLNVPGLWFMSWYDVSVGPNLALYNHVRQTASREVADEQWAIIAPVAHCSYTRATADTVVGERSMGDARLDYNEIVYGFFDRFLKDPGAPAPRSAPGASAARSQGEPSSRLSSLPKVTYYTMGLNKWQTAETWPPAGAQPMTFYLASGGKANSLSGDGVLATAAPDADKPDAFTYDPMNPVLSYGGNVCCTGTAVQAGAFDQRRMEAREDILVFTSEPFKEGTEVSGPMTPTLYVSSDAKDTDFTVKILDVYPDGRAYNLDESIQRMRYRDGYDKPVAWMENGKIYKVALQPLNTSNYFDAGHRLRIEVSSSNFPRFDRNLNTGGRNYDEATGVVAHNAVHHSKQYPSQITVTVVKRTQAPSTPAQ
ncbi:MAG TPA: CocE/NonD family hydrolase [Vicinamibacterales bacterium]|nr:CocE/NonD family hydrolase [Vicinamibacterales bacterium]